MGFRNGQLKRLRISHPDLFKHLVIETQMGRELVRLKLILGGYKDASSIEARNPRSLIEEYPDFFDKV
jgi:hypothetical protein